MNRHLKTEHQLVTACKRHNPAAGATQGYDRLHAERYGITSYLRKKPTP